MKKFVSMFKNPIVKVGLLLAFFAAAAVIVIAMMLGNEAGQFVIRVQSGNVEKSIGITEDLSDEHPGNTLKVNGMSGITDYSPSHFLEKEYSTLKALTDKPGMTDYDHKSLYIYTFYIKNTSAQGGVGVRATLSFSHVTNNLDEVIRVLTYTTGYGNDDPYIYQKPDDIAKLKTKFPDLTKVEYPDYMLQPIPFLNSTTVYDQTFNIGYGEGQDYVKYSVLFWLEGDDPDSEFYEDGLFNGTIRFQLTLSVEM